MSTAERGRHMSLYLWSRDIVLLAAQDTPDISLDGLGDLTSDRRRGKNKALELSRLVPTDVPEYEGRAKAFVTGT